MNIIMGHYIEKDKMLFFGTKDVLIKPMYARYPQLLRDLGIYKSATEAVRAGFDSEIPEGFSIITVGKSKKELCVLKRQITWKNRWESFKFIISGLAKI